MEDEKVARAHQIGIDLANAAKDISSAGYKSEPGTCPHCHSRNFYLNDNSTEAVCCLCGIIGEIKVVDGKVVFEFPEEQLEYAHDTLSGKLIHAGDIQKNEGKNMEMMKTDEYKARVKKYKDFISASVPE